MVPHIKTFTAYLDAYKRSIDNPEKFWEEVANAFLWEKKWDTVLSWDFAEPKIN